MCVCGVCVSVGWSACVFVCVCCVFGGILCVCAVCVWRVFSGVCGVCGVFARVVLYVWSVVCVEGV